MSGDAARLFVPFSTGVRGICGEKRKSVDGIRRTLNKKEPAKKRFLSRADVPGKGIAFFSSGG